MATIIRPACAGDAAALLALWGEIDQVHHAARPDLFAGGASKSFRPPLAKVLADPEHRLLVAEQDDRVIGALRATRRHEKPPWAPASVVIVHEVVVAAPFRSGGVGRQLMLAAHAWAREVGATAVWLGVWDFNATALALYQSLGYEPIHHRLRLSNLQPEPA